MISEREMGIEPERPSDIPQMPVFIVEKKWPASLIIVFATLSWFTVLGFGATANWAVEKAWPPKVEQKAPDRKLEPWCYSLQQDMRAYDDRRREELSR